LYNIEPRRVCHCQSLNPNSLGFALGAQWYNTSPEIEGSNPALGTWREKAGNTKGRSITVLLTSCLTGLDKSVLQIRTKIVSCLTADSKPVKQEVNSIVILPPLVFPGESIRKVPTLHESIRQGPKHLIVTNALAYYTNLYFTNVIFVVETHEILSHFKM
jgi:hypothetical protein